MAKLTTEELIEQFKELTLIELSEFVKAFEETFGQAGVIFLAISLLVFAFTTVQRCAGADVPCWVVCRAGIVHVLQLV